MSASTLADPAREARRFFSWVARFSLGYTLFVILFGAVVRITGSGAGCGQHWPTCHGDITHLPQTLETLIELTHRVTSGFALVAVVLLLVAAFRAEPPGHRVRALAVAAVALMIVEALIGAALVLLELVGTNASVARAVVMPAHLVSTYALTAVLTLLVVLRDSVPRGALPALLGSGWVALALVGLVAVSATGAVTALGDTVQPPTSGTLGGRIAEDYGQGATFLTRLRVIHPVLAVLVSAFAATAARRLGADAGSDAARSAARAVLAVVAVQLVAGVVNVLLSAPGWLQVVHLGLALAVWIAFWILVVRRAETFRAPG